MELVETSLEGVVLLKPDVHGDDRGFFVEYFHSERFRNIGIDLSVAQFNHSHSRRGVLRGMHYQLQHPQAKLVQVLRGEVLDVVVDIRKGSPTFGKYAKAVLSESNRQQLFVPGGFAHGFCVLSESVDFLYLCSDIYRPDDEYGIAWDDLSLDITWPQGIEFELSSKDQNWPCLADADAILPVFGG
ncbi:dTDP-4-dehydrorhamnose 3,5-epimerase [hydrothermal vent metagenome]|uniref:dTDP-4-dehydrorhamnose 3,5-epimerase n=1 Tax=hydrothermal vent metagenome TaxID=652676 RepID=A0A3B0Y8T9_9ZZZZ